MDEVKATNIFEAINNVMAVVGYVQKESKGQLRYTYASESALIAALRPAMVVEKITMYCEDVYGIEVREYTSKQDSAMVNVSLTGKWRFTHAPSGTSIIVTARGEGSDSGDKANSKAMTGSMKYALRQTFLIETGDDPDKDQQDERKDTSHEPANWKPDDIESLVQQQYFKNKWETSNALKLSKALKPGLTPFDGIKYWVERYNVARHDGKLEPAQSAEVADREYLAEKERKIKEKEGAS